MVASPPADPVLQTTPWNESETYTFPARSNVMSFSPAPGTRASGRVMNGADEPVLGSTASTRAVPKSTTSSAPVAGCNRSPSRFGLAFGMVTRRTSRPWRSNTKSSPEPEAEPNVAT
jgi:hypothetical protein